MTIIIDSVRGGGERGHRTLELAGRIFYSLASL